ncbi:two-component sensor histidine kinase, partial [Rhizobiaceae sp. 2RAB30]
MTKVPTLGWSTVPSGAFGLAGDAAYRSYSGTFDGNRLVVAMSYAETDELLGIALTSFGWGFIFIVAMMFGGGILLASRVQRRMDA